MTLEQFLAFGHQLHYPALLLGNGELLPAGRDAWFHFLYTEGKERIEQAIARAERMQARMAERKETA